MADTPRLIGIVDDEGSLRVALCRLCNVYGLHPRAFASAQLLFDAILDGSRFDCLILDVQMPGAGGLDILQWLQDHGYRIPAVMITGREDDQMRARSFVLGARAYLFKPVEADVLLRAVRDAIESPPDRSGVSPSSRAVSPPGL